MKNGFTLIEILITLGVSVILFSAGTFITVDAYKSAVFEQGFNLFLDLLEKTRSEAMNNINNKPQTLKINAKDYQIKINGPAEITFQNLSGDVAAGATFTLTDGIREKDISVEESGRLNW